MQIPAFARNAFTAPGTDNAAVAAKTGEIDFDAIKSDNFAWTKTLPGAGLVPFIPAGRYSLVGLPKAGREGALMMAVEAVIDNLSHAGILGAAVSLDGTALEVWTRPGWNPLANLDIRAAIEDVVAAHETPEKPSGMFKRLVYSEKAERAQLATDRRESFIENFLDRKLFGA